MPTGVALRDVREHLFAAADRVLLRDGPSGLTSRAVTAEAEVAKGVLHRHFTDFDDFLAAFVQDRAHRIDAQATTLLNTAGQGTVADNITAALDAVFMSVAMAIVPLITFRDELRARLRDTWPAGVPVLTEAAEMLADYLRAEQKAGRVAKSASADLLAPTLIGAAHLLFADRTGPRPTIEALRRTVITVLSGAQPE
ncbi:TetR/AcrR family transcriptional regulator [Saccharothrix variisporea]|uniref:TetR family transcriptional regulator n=1 Tax=Saccharothrix variisporea TaxID=543527 RepID=A0A495X685_9PSEU|nr:TetR family transcriptional regulator [Saccharothrix variisporea]RKT69066.1 TetR family transcriptional regulator [Saccharothrix variisporea]